MNKKLKELISKRQFAELNSKEWAKTLKAVDAEIATLINAENILREAGKLENGGSKTIELDGCKINIEAAKKIKWDSKILQAVARTMDWKMAEVIFKIKFEISETKYNDMVANTQGGMFDESLLAKINDARTVEIGEPQVKSAEFIEGE